MSTATVIRLAEAPRFGQDGTAITGYVSPTRGASLVASWRVELSPGTSSPEHTLTHGEAFIALEGEATFTVGDQTHLVRAGDAISVPPETPLRLENTGPGPFAAICSMTSEGRAQLAGGAPFVPPWAA